MCGIVGYIGGRPVRELLLSGLTKLEYRGYDSAGLSVIAHLSAEHYVDDLAEAVRCAYAQLEGHYAFVAMSLDDPDVLVGARKECPLVVGRGEGEQFVASAVPAFLAETRRVQYLENGEIVILRPEGVTITNSDGVPVERAVET